MDIRAPAASNLKNIGLDETETENVCCGAGIKKFLSNVAARIDKIGGRLRRFITGRQRKRYRHPNSNKTEVKLEENVVTAVEDAPSSSSTTSTVTEVPPAENEVAPNQPQDVSDKTKCPVMHRPFGQIPDIIVTSPNGQILQFERFKTRRPCEHDTDQCCGCEFGDPSHEKVPKVVCVESNLTKKAVSGIMCKSSNKRKRSKSFPKRDIRIVRVDTLPRIRFIPTRFEERRLNETDFIRRIKNLPFPSMQAVHPPPQNSEQCREVASYITPFVGTEPAQEIDFEFPLSSSAYY